MRITKTKAASVIAATAVVALAGTGAMAYWTTTGSGTGSATTGTTVPLSITQTNTVPALHVGESSPIDLRVTNGATYNQFISGVTISAAFASGFNAQSDTSKPACTIAGDFTITQPTGISGDLTPGAHDYAGSTTGAKIALNNTAANQDNCKNASLVLTFSA
jgi:hypothetical protein